MRRPAGAPRALGGCGTVCSELAQNCARIWAEDEAPPQATNCFPHSVPAPPPASPGWGTSRSPPGPGTQEHRSQRGPARGLGVGTFEVAAARPPPRAAPLGLLSSPPAPESFCFHFIVPVATTSLPPIVFLFSVTLSSYAEPRARAAEQEVWPGEGGQGGTQPGGSAAPMCPKGPLERALEGFLNVPLQGSTPAWPCRACPWRGTPGMASWPDLNPPPTTLSSPTGQPLSLSPSLSFQDMLPSPRPGSTGLCLPQLPGTYHPPPECPLLVSGLLVLTPPSGGPLPAGQAKAFLAPLAGAQGLHTGGLQGAAPSPQPGRPGLWSSSTTS